jgi:glycosyltransferase involved in cell wall biosynthesis
MRIVVTSAHFPPNFVSGGTLQPQRLAHGLRARGHDVSVYAGWLDEGREPGTSWSELDATGMAVRWIVTTPWTGWELRRNFDNPEVTADFTEYLAVTSPDVVHFHALQSLGAGLLAAASASGAAVVVTMHDFWWCCARQFLVDREMQPCSVVVDAGACECSVNRQWLVARNEWLRDQLQHADLVLTPSASAAAVLAANGVVSDRIEVDENGLPDREAAPKPAVWRASREARPVRFVYAGGPDELKGVRVLFDAFEQLEGTDGWHLDAYGAGAWLTQHGRRVDESRIDIRPPFAAREVDNVLASGDVLVVPSVARESYSILTREALAHGLAVVSSDCVGPEEVVEHSRNGLIVPSGDATELARAIRSVVDDPGLLEKLRPGPGDVTLRSLDDQVDGLQSHYQRLRADRSPRQGPTTVRRVLFIVGIDGAPLRYRAWLPAEALGLLGVHSEIRWFTDPDLPEEVDRSDVVVVYRVPATDWVLEVVGRARGRGLPVLFDADDLIFDRDVAVGLPALETMSRDDAERYLHGVDRYRTTMEACDAYIASTPMLARHAREMVKKPVERFDNGVGIRLGGISDHEARRQRQPGALRIGYFSGTDTHDHDWRSIEAAIEGVLSKHQQVQLWLGGRLGPTPRLDGFGERVRRLPFQKWTELPATLRDVDVNLSPLVLDNGFNEAKSAIKWLEAALVATPTIASPTESFRDAIDDGRNGLLARTDDEWVAAIERLLEDDALRTRLGQRARRDALLRWSPHLQARRYLDILERSRVSPSSPDIVTGKSTWTPVVVHEAPRRHRIEAYGQHDRRRTARSIRNSSRDVRRRMQTAFATHGVLGAVVRVPRAIVRALRAAIARTRDE